MQATAALQRMSSTRGGMRKMLKTRPPTVQFIKWAVQTGIYKGIHHPQGGAGQQQQMRGGGGRNDRFRPKIDKYPIEYEILTLNPPMPEPPRLSKKDLKRMSREASSQQELPTDVLVKNYMKRYDARVKAAQPLTDAEREEYHYRKMLGVHNESSGPRAQDMNTAMGRKSAVLNHAYDFALKQYEVMQTDEGLTEAESIAIVEELLANEEKDERVNSRAKARQIVHDMSENTPDRSASAGDNNGKKSNAVGEAAPEPPSATIPSILYSKPRTIQALNLWGKRLGAVPYNQWTLGATTALDHWIAIDVLGMSEETWDRLLEGQLEFDLEESRGTDVILGDMARGKDIVAVRSTLFPETVIHSPFEDAQDLVDDELENVDDSEKDATEKSIDELLASLGEFESDADETTEDSNTVSEADDEETRISDMMDSLQEWRARNEERPFEEWSDASKGQFQEWMTDYISLVTTEGDGNVDLDATRRALLSEPPSSREEAESFWSQIQDEADAEILLHSLNKAGYPSIKDDESPSEKRGREALEIFLGLPYPKQLRQLINLSTLQPIFDEYYSESDRTMFMSHYGETLLEGTEIEHLVLDPNGNITPQDIGDKALVEKQSINENTTFSIQMIPYGTDEFGRSRSDRARALYRAWNMQKAGRARYAESQFKKGQMPLDQQEKTAK